MIFSTVQEWYRPRNTKPKELSEAQKKKDNENYGFEPSPCDDEGVKWTSYPVEAKNMNEYAQLLKSLRLDNPNLAAECLRLTLRRPLDQDGAGQAESIDAIDMEKGIQMRATKWNMPFGEESQIFQIQSLFPSLYKWVHGLRQSISQLESSQWGARATVREVRDINRRLFEYLDPLIRIFIV